MRKIVILSFDDGTEQDRRLAQLLRRRGIPGTFNLNSGLGSFVWQFEGRDVVRPPLEEKKAWYVGHEVASHSLTHPWLPGLSGEELAWEVGEDCRNIRRVFGVEKLGFAVPFTECAERETAVIRDLVAYIRLSRLSVSFAPPPDPWHIPIHALYHQPDAGERLEEFARSRLPVSLFVLCGHSYELEFLHQWGLLEELLDRAQAIEGVEFMTTMDFVKEFYGA